MSTLRVFKSRIASVNYLMPNGKPIPFIAGVYRTDIPGEIEHLETEIKGGHPHIFIDPEDREIDSELVDPMARLRHTIIADYLAANKAATDPNRDMGESAAPKSLNVTSSRDVAEAAMGGSGVSTEARLVNLRTSK